MVSPCRCNAEGRVVTQTRCMVLELGMGYMPEFNWCDQPYPCRQCEGDLVAKSACKGGTIDDTTCDCPDGRYQTGPTTCQDIPRCPKDHQSQRVPEPGVEYIPYKCVHCPAGFIQPKDNSTDMCYARPNPGPEDVTPENPISDTPGQHQRLTTTVKFVGTIAIPRAKPDSTTVKTGQTIEAGTSQPISEDGESNHCTSRTVWYKDYHIYLTALAILSLMGLCVLFVVKEKGANCWRNGMCRERGAVRYHRGNNGIEIQNV